MPDHFTIPDYAPTVICLGARGMLGQALVRQMTECGWDVVELYSKDVDLGDPYQVRQALSQVGESPVVVVNAAAYTAVDDCETQQEQAFRVNGEGPGHLAEICRENGWRLVHFSTDYVYASGHQDPLIETDPVAPLNMYGQSKLAGEHAVIRGCPDHLVFRVQWLYGAGGQHFVGTMRRLASERAVIQVVDDQVGGPSYTGHIAQAVVAAIAAEVPAGVYNLANLGYVSWYGLCVELKSLLGLDVQFTPVGSDQFPRPAVRPLNSRLDMSKFLNLQLGSMPFWQDALKEYLDESDN